jgi:hypothetical protein
MPVVSVKIQTKPLTHQVPPTIPGLISAIKTKYEIEPTSEIRNVFRKNKQGAIVQFDDGMVKFYSHEAMFIVQVCSCFHPKYKSRFL